jgi:hypothetical protein
MDAAEMDAADKYRDCCARDALVYYQELAKRLGGGNDNNDFYEWSKELLSPVKSKEWNRAREHASLHIITIGSDLESMALKLDGVVTQRAIDEAFKPQ